ncbi:MAG: hypothetical protein V1676_03275 [Candidatus Diapherotrites archaeon]
MNAPSKIYEPIKVPEPVKDNKATTNITGTGAVAIYTPMADGGTVRAITRDIETVMPPTTKTASGQTTYNLLSGEVKTSNKTITLKDMRKLPARAGPTVTVTTNSGTYKQNELIGLFIGLTNPEAERPVDFYLVMLSPEQDLYFYPSWTNTPQYIRTTLPANLYIPPYDEGTVGMIFEIPSNHPPITNGQYVFAAGVAKQGTLDFYSIDDASINVQGGSGELTVQLFPEETFIESGGSQDFFAVVSGTIDGVFAAPHWTMPYDYCTAEFCTDLRGCTLTCTNPTSNQLALDITFRLTEIEGPMRTARDTSKIYVAAGGSGGNTQPHAVFDVNPTSGNTSTRFEVYANNSYDAEDTADQLQVRWDWEDDGYWDTEYVQYKAEAHYYSTGGNKTIRLSVMDSGGLTDQTTRAIYVDGNSTGEPRCGDIYINADDVTLNEGETKYRQFSYGNNSGERFYVENVDVGVVSGGNYFGANGTGSYDGSINSHGSGNYEVRVEAYSVDRDESGTAYVKVSGRFDGGKYCSYGDIGERQFTVYVQNEGGGNNEPYIEYVNVYPNPVEPGDSVNFEVHWSDPEYSAVQPAPAGNVVQAIGNVVIGLPLVREFVGAVAAPVAQVAQDINASLPGNDRTKMFICKTSSHDSGGCSGGTWCSADGYSSYSPSYCDYGTSSGDSGTKNYYAFVCDDDGQCSSAESGTFTIEGGSTGELDVSIEPGSATVESGEEQKFYANVSGGDGGYSYDWRLSSYDNCQKDDYDREFRVTCTNESSSTMNRTIYLNVTSGSKSGSASAKLYVEPGNSGQDLSVSIEPESAIVWSGESQTFTAYAYGGSGQYDYGWSLSAYSDCETNDYGDEYRVTCTNDSSSQRNITVYLNVTSGSKSESATAKLYVEPTGGDNGGVGPDMPNPCIGLCYYAGLWGCENKDSSVDNTKTFSTLSQAEAYFENKGYHVVPFEYSYMPHYGSDFGKPIEKGYRWQGWYTSADGSIDTEGPEPDSEPTDYMIGKGYWPINVAQWHLSDC